MATNKWTASSAGYWNTPGNWGLGHVPTAGEDVLFDGTGAGKCTLNVDTVTLGSFTISATNTADFDDGGYTITTTGTFDILLANLVHITMAGKVVVTGDANFTINGDGLASYSDGYFTGAPEIDFQGSGTLTLMWYAYVGGVWDAADGRKVTMAYPGKTCIINMAGNMYGLVTKGGTIDLTTGFVLNFYLVDSNFVFDIDPGTTWITGVAPAPLMYLTFRNPAPATFNFSGINIPGIQVYNTSTYADIIPSFGDAILNFNGDWTAGDFNASEDMGGVVGANRTYNINGTFNLASLRFSNVSHVYRVKWYFGSSILNIANYVNTHMNSTQYGDGRIQLYLESSVWTILGQVAYGGDNAIWFVGWKNLDIFPGTSTVIIRPAAVRDFQNGLSQTGLGGYYAFYNLFIEGGVGYIDGISLPLIVENEFRWENSGTYAWSNPQNTGLQLAGSTPKIKLESNFHGRLQTKVPGQVVTWETLNGSGYTIDLSSIGDINGSSASFVEWKSATPATTYKINATVPITLGAIKVTDCNNIGTTMKISKATYIDGGNNTGVEAISSSVFVAPSVVDDTPVNSTLDKDILVSLIQQQGVDPYFDTPSEIMKVVVYYTHSDGRQFQYAIFEGNPMTGQFTWGTGAKDGIWYKNKVVVYDWNNAKKTLTDIPLESLVHATGTMTLNVT